MGGKQRIMALYQTQTDRNLRAKALAKEYGTGGHSHDFLVVGVMVEFQTLPVVIHKAPASVQKIVGMPTDAVLLCQRLGKIGRAHV